MEPTTIYQYTIPDGLRFCESSSDSPRMVLGLIRKKRVSPFSIADILGIKSSKERDERIIKEEQKGLLCLMFLFIV